MAFSAKKFNKQDLFEFKPPAGYEYKKLYEAVEIYKGLNPDSTDAPCFMVRALYINKKSKFGESPTIATNGFYINLPKHQLDTVKEIMSDEEAIDAINRGAVGIEIYDYVKEGKTYQSVRWVDI